MDRVPLPTHLQVEITAACNLRCRMCLVGHRPPVDRLTGSMDVRGFADLLDDLPGLRSLTLQGLGEPLLAPRLAEMIALAKARGIETGFNTNGTLLDERHRRWLLDLGVDWVHVSLDAASPTVFEGIRLGVSFERVVGHLRALVADRGAGSRPRVQLNAVLMRRTLNELQPLVRLAADIGVDRLWVQQLSHDLGDTAGRPEFASLRAFTEAECLWTGTDGDEAAVRAAVAAARRLAAELGLDVRLPAAGASEVDGDEEADEVDEADETGTPADDLPCDWPWRSSYVNHDGRVQPCCMLMGDDRATLGHVQRPGDFARIWNDGPYAEFRRKLLGPEPPEVCRGCSQYRGRF